MDLKIAEILKITRAGTLLQGCKQEFLNRNVVGISTDSRKLKRGELFIALRGDKFNGNDFVSKALQKGAVGAIVSGINSQFPLPGSQKPRTNNQFIIQVPDTLKTLGDIAKYYRSKFKIPLIAITGSCGKTTTKEIIFALLSSKFKVLKTKANYNNLIGLPLTLFDIDDKYDVAVLEMGMSRAGEIKRLAEIAQANTVVITNVAKAHKEFFRSLKDIAEAKSEIFKISPQPKISILNRDDKFFSRFASKTKGEIITFGIDRKSDFRAEEITFDSFGRPSFYLNGKMKIKTPFLGRGNIYNILASFAVAFSLGTDIKESISALSEIELLPGRANFYKAKDIYILDDTYNANPLSFANLIRLIDEIKIEGKKVLVLGDMLELGKDSKEEHIKAGKLISDSSVDILITIGQKTKFTAETISKDKKAWHFNDKNKAKKKLEILANKGDLLAIKGSRALEMEKMITAIKGGLQ